MDLINIVLLIRVALGFGLGVYLANRWKEVFRGIVIRCMPIKHRISERSYLLQTRITSIVGIVFAILVAVLINIALMMGWQKMGWPSIIEQQSITPKLIPIPSSPVIPNLPKKEEIVPVPDPVLPDRSILTQTSIIPKTTTINRNPQPVSVPQKEVVYLPKNMVYYQQIALPVYLQIYAFTIFPKAQQQRARWIGQTPYPVRVGYFAQDYAPYKVVIGPFPSRQAANHFKNKITIPAFIRPVDGLQFFE